MASLPCSFCDNESAILLVTSLVDGETVNVGPACMAGYALGMAAAVTADLPAERADEYGPAIDAIKANDPRPAEPAADASAPRRRHAAPKPGTASTDAEATAQPPHEGPEGGGESSATAPDAAVADNVTADATTQADATD